jgi:propionate catabolism operon transcriptional regulator
MLKGGGVQDKPYQIGVIISSQSLVERIQKRAQDESHRIHVSRATFTEAVSSGKKMEAKGVEVIISRWGVASELRANLRIPVLSIPHASVDLITSLRQASKRSDRIILTSFLDKMHGLSVLEELLHVEIRQIVYRDIPSLEKALQSARHDGYGVAVGGGWTMRIAEREGLAYVELGTSEENIAAAFEDAKSVAQANREEKKRAYRYQCIIDAATEGIIAVDNNGRIDVVNDAARAFMNIPSQDVTDQPVSLFVKSPSVRQVLNAKAPVWNRLERINDDLFVFNHRPVEMNGEIIGGVSTFKDVTNVMGAENAIRQSLTKGLVAKYSIDDLVYADPVMRTLVSKAEQFAKTDSTILLVGATGTGKEIMAQSIHTFSKRGASPFVSVHCGALPEQLIESELFGYEEGAFTGSKKGGSPGRFEMAHKGTIFLDEIDTTPLNMQTRLLRILQEQEVMRVGGRRKIPIDVRIIAAAGRDLESAVQEGRFREDLFFRLNVLRINIPPLKDRVQDIPVLLNHYVDRLSARHGFDPISLPAAYVEKLMTYSWPGNVRQLRNFVERLVLNANLRCSADPMEELYEELIQYPPRHKQDGPAHADRSLKKEMQERKRDQESALIREALEDARFNKTRAAKALGITRTTLWRKMKAARL